MSSFLKKKMISIAGPVLAGSQVHRLFDPFFSGLGHILMFHRVIPASKKLRIHNHQSLEVTPKHLEETIAFFKQRKYAFISLDEMHKRIRQKNYDKRFVVITFDDGYLDNYTYAWPILRKHKIPFTIYVTTNFPDRKAILWWYMLEDMILERSHISFEWAGESYHFECRDIQEKEETFAQIRTLITQGFTIDTHVEMLETIFSGFELNLYSYVKKMAMGWEHIRELSKDKRVTIAAHTVNHYPLRQLDEYELEPEIMHSKMLIETYTKKEVQHFAYPFGKAAEASYREFEFIKSQGFKTATTTRIGNIFPAHRNHMEALPRISINAVTDKPVLQLQTSGMLSAIVNKGRKVITH